MRKLILLTATALALFSCNNGEDDLTQERTKSVVVQFAPSALSRVAGAPVTASDAATISDYTIFFLDAAGNVVEGTKTGNTKPTDAVACTGVGKTATSVYVVANTASAIIDLGGITLANKSTLADIKAKFAGMDTQKNIASVVLANSIKSDNGKIEIGVITDGKAAYTAAVEISPVICRLEIGQIHGIDGITTGFKLEGIYIDGHAVNFNVGGGYDKTVLDPNVEAGTGIYSIGVDNSKLNSGYPTNFCDVATIAATGSSGNFVAKPADSKVWTYQLAAGAPMPKIIVKLSGVNGGTDTKYVTVTSYKNGGTNYPTLVSGTVYKIAEISFKMENTAEVPNATEKEVSVTVSIKNWDVVTLTPEV